MRVAPALLQTGLALGAALGPIVFGMIATASGYRAAWSAMAVLTVLAGITVHLGRRLARRATGPWANAGA